MFYVKVKRQYSKHTVEKGVVYMNNFSEAFQSLHQAAVQRERSAHVIHHEMDGQLMLKIHRTQLKPVETIINERGIVEKKLLEQHDRVILKQFEKVFSVYSI